MLKSILNSENISLGINADYLYLTYGNFWFSDNGYEENMGSIRIGSKLGPSFTYSPMDKMAIDICAKADFAWASSATAIYLDTPEDADDYYSAYATLGFSTGLNFRYGLLILGIEYNTISPKLESNEYSGNYLGNATNDGDKTSLPCMNFTIGMSF